jgi:dihydrofolate reductase
MSKVRINITMSLDGYVAGPNQSMKDPLGVGGEAMHKWVIELAAFKEMHGQTGGIVNANSAIMEEMFANVGAVIMGRNMFGGGPGRWKSDWKGWWGEDPPFHVPVFVLTHHPREPLRMQGGTTFTFVTEGIESALEQARAAAGGKDVSIAGGASTVQQCLSAGELDELHLHVVPIVLGAGERLLENVGTPKLEIAGVVASPGVTHVKYRVVR